LLQAFVVNFAPPPKEVGLQKLHTSMLSKMSQHQNNDVYM